MIANGTHVSYSYRQHALLGGALVENVGTVIDWTMVGADRAYVIKPLDGGNVVHVRFAGVRAI